MQRGQLNASSSSLLLFACPFPVEYTFDYEVQRPLLFGGPFKSPYIFEMIHFHWGPLKKSGSEHYINSKPYHMEMHITHRHPSYQDMTEAAKYKNGIVVLAILFEVLIGSLNPIKLTPISDLPGV